jgi:hypothetical protein
VCGLGYDTDCDACRAAADREAEAALSLIDRAVRRWQALYERHRGPLRGAVDHRQLHPEPLAAAELARLAWTLLHPRTRALLRELLRDLLAEDVADIALAVAQEARQ